MADKNGQDPHEWKVKILEVIKDPYLCTIALILLTITGYTAGAAVFPEHIVLPGFILILVLILAVILIKYLDRAPSTPPPGGVSTGGKAEEPVLPPPPPQSEGTVCLPSRDGSRQIPIYNLYNFSNDMPDISPYQPEKDGTLTYQDFSGTKNPIQDQWASPFGGGKINTVIENGMLVVDFSSTHHLKSKLTIRPHDKYLFELPPDKNYFVMSVRVRKNADKKRQPLALAVRIINGYCQHWAYHEQAQLTEEPLEIEIPLYRKDKPWNLFLAAGNVYYDNPKGKTAQFSREDTFKYILGITLELGSTGVPYLVGGQGIIEISGIYFK